MLWQRQHSGLAPKFKSPPLDGPEIVEHITEEAGITSPKGDSLRLDLLVAEGDSVPQGGAVAQLRDEPGVQLVSPMPARVAHIRLLPGRKLSEIVLFREPEGDKLRHQVKFDAANSDSEIRSLVQKAGLWPMFERRPFGGMPKAEERPAAIVVMTIDTRPLAVDPRHALDGRNDAFVRGLSALTSFTDGQVFVCHSKGSKPFEATGSLERVKAVPSGGRHPQGLAGFRIHDLAPASIDQPVWSCHAEDVVAMGELLETGYLPETRLVGVGGEGLRNSRLVRTQPGADLRELVHRFALPGPHHLLSGSPLDGVEAHWLGARDRQVTVLPNKRSQRSSHWLLNALARSSLPPPVIPTKALTQAFGSALPAAAFTRALASGDEETAVKLGLLSFLEEDFALADYVLGGEGHLSEMLNFMLARIEKEYSL